MLSKKTLRSKQLMQSLLPSSHTICSGSFSKSLRGSSFDSSWTWQSNCAAYHILPWLCYPPVIRDEICGLVVLIHQCL